MTKQSNDHIRTLFTEIGCIMEDASVIALIWDDADPMPAQDRYRALLRANDKIDAALKNVKATIDGG